MQRFSNVLVGVDLHSGDRLAADDLSATTRVAVERAIWLAGQAKAKLTFGAALELSAEGFEELQHEEEQGVDTVQEVALGVLDELVEKARAKGVEAERVLSYGRAWEEVIRQVQRADHDLVVCGSSNRSAASRLFFGTTSSKLMRFCPCPVWVTRPDPYPEQTTILVPSDFSDVSSKALEIGVEAAQLGGAKLVLMHALQRTRDTMTWASGRPSSESPQALEERKAAVEARLHEQLSHTDYRTLPFGVKVEVRTGPSEIAILDALEEDEVDVLVMGTIARAGVSGWLVGNTCERLLPEVQCSVVAVKPDGYKSPVNPD